MPLTLSGSNGVAGVDGSAGTPALQGSDSNTGIAFGADTIIGSTGGSERFRCDSSGRLLVGATTAPSAGNAQYSKLVVQGNTYLATDYGILNLQRGLPASGGITGNLGGIHFSDNAGNEFGLIQCAADGTTASSDYPGRLVFSTTADGASSPTERMRINSNGRLLIGTTAEIAVSENTNPGIMLANDGTYLSARNSTSPNFFVSKIGTGNDGDVMRFARNGSQVGSISVSSTATAYNTSSDYRLKENIEPVSDGVTRLQQLKPSRFNFIADPDKTVDGFIAHEVQAVVPEAIHGTKDEVDADGNPVYQGIDQSKLVPLLTAALQEAIAKIESLETRLAALEVT